MTISYRATLRVHNVMNAARGDTSIREITMEITPPSPRFYIRILGEAATLLYLHNNLEHLFGVGDDLRYDLDDAGRAELRVYIQGDM